MMNSAAGSRPPPRPPGLTCARCLGHAVQGPDLAHLERGPHFMTAVRVTADHARRQHDRRQNPEGAAGVHAWACSSGHCRMSQQVRSRWTDYCGRTPNCVTALKGRRGVQASDKTLGSGPHIIVGDEREQRFGLFSPARGRVLRAQACLSRVQHFAVSACLLPKPRALSPPFLFTSAMCPH